MLIQLLFSLAVDIYYFILKKNFMSLHTYMSCIVACAIISFSATAQTNISTDTEGKPMLLGIHSWKELKQKPYRDWFKKNYKDYTVNDTIMPALKKALQGYDITVFMGSWCGDSKREVPRLIKILRKADFSIDNFKIVFVNDHDSAYKQSPQHEEAGRYIYRVPTIIIEKNNTEVGRIVEHPVESLEKDLLKICTGEKYQPTFTAGIDIWKKLEAGTINLKDSVAIKQAYQNEI